MADESKALTPMQSFQERLRASLRDDVARMIPDEALAEMIQQVIKEEFFTKRVIDDPSDTGWNKRKITKGTVFQDIVMEHAKPILERLAREWVQENTQLLAEQWKAVTDTGLLQYVEELQRKMATEHLRTQLNEWLAALNQERVSKGLTPLATPLF